MINQNISCPGDSGKEDMTCCSINQAAQLQEMVKREAVIIRQRFINVAMPQCHIENMMERIEEWFPQLSDFFAHQLIDVLFFDTFVYVDNEALWKAFLHCELTKPQHPQVRVMLEAWLNPFWLLAKVVSLDSDSVRVRDELTRKVYNVENKAHFKVGKWLFGIAFHNLQDAENRLFETQGLIVIPHPNQKLIDELRTKIEYFNGDSLGLYLTIKREAMGRNE